MYISLCLNPSLDRTIYLDTLNLGELNRTKYENMTVGGKGINIARAMRLFGQDCMVCGFSGGRFGEILESALERENILFDFVKTEAQTRMNLKLIDGVEKKRFTEINSAGGPIKESEYTGLVEKLLNMLRSIGENDNNYLFLSGSFPQGVENSVYNFFISEAKKLKFKCVVDCDKIALEKALLASPYMIKPNQYELELLAHKSFSTENQLKDYINSIYDQFGTRVLCTRGEKGSLYVGPEGTYNTPAVDIIQGNPVGAGDVSLAAFIYFYDFSHNIEKALRFSSAAGGAMAETEGCDMPSIVRIKELGDRYGN